MTEVLKKQKRLLLHFPKSLEIRKYRNLRGFSWTLRSAPFPGFALGNVCLGVIRKELCKVNFYDISFYFSMIGLEFYEKRWGETFLHCKAMIRKKTSVTKSYLISIISYLTNTSYSALHPMRSDGLILGRNLSKENGGSSGNFPAAYNWVYEEDAVWRAQVQNF